MAIVCIKIGENEPQNYARFDKLSHHGDIIQTFKENINIGSVASKHFLVLTIDKLEDKATDMLMEQEISGEEILRKRLRYLDLTLLPLPQPARDIISVQRVNKQNIKISLYSYKQAHPTASREQLAKKKDEFEKNFDLSTVNKTMQPLSFTAFAKAVINKRTNKTLLEELNG